MKCNLLVLIIMHDYSWNNDFLVASPHEILNRLENLFDNNIHKQTNTSELIVIDPSLYNRAKEWMLKIPTGKSWRFVW